MNDPRSVGRATLEGYSYDRGQGRLMLKRIKTMPWALLLSVLIWLHAGCDSRDKLPPLASDTRDTKYFTALHLRQFEETRHQAIDLCSNCHAKGSSKKARRFRKPIPQLCYDCHEDYRTLNRYVHGPVAVGACMICHDPHVSMYIHLQRIEQPRLCTQCHEIGMTFIPENHPDTSDKLCTECHDAHAGSNEMLLKK